ncbi:hypothetical protein Glove_139g215 [Diversispora epigaea]|uniref:Ion transport domain-containing protein n=1 Tax=Diversispora epigaea TaxID=1348612 RepID=A0A397J4G3_9GLOM|nr:hypothetical protein Glove_139g215 [Diversispora epigaea]
MSTEHYSSSPNQISSSTNSTGRDPLFFGIRIAISPDGKQIVTFSPESHEFKLYTNINNVLRYAPDNNLNDPTRIECEVNDKHLCWSIAVSNFVNENERLIAFSCFDAREFLHNGDDESSLDSGDKVNNKCNGNDERDLESGSVKYRRNLTRVISTKDGSEIHASLECGVIRFLDSDDSDQTLIIVNASGIFKETMKKKARKQFELPQQLSNHISRDFKDSLELLQTSIIKNHFIVNSFKNRQQIIEMYSLITGDLEMSFKRHEYSIVPNIIHGSPIFAISQNEKILAFCETTSITLYLMENGLEITTKQLKCQRGIYKIANINFIDADSKLLIVLVEKEDRLREISKHHQIFVVWDLFTTFENSVRQIDTRTLSETNKPLKMKIDVTLGLMNSHGNVFAVKDGGNIFSVLDLPDVKSIINPSAKATTEIDVKTKDHVYHAIYNINGERFDASKLEENRIIIANVEPWHLNKNYFRISVYLDSIESTQLIISHNTIQVWKYRNNNTIERVLEYIWARNKVIDVQELKIGEREFKLEVSIPSSIPTKPPKLKTIHWPNNVNVLEGACRALYVLGESKHFITTFENVNKHTYLVECTQRLVRKYITKYGIFRLTSIRYPIMKYLIKSYQESLIKIILNKKINSNIYIPRLYKWPDEDNRSTTEIPKSDLHHAILSQKRGDSTVILKYLIDYYADNSKEYNNLGWMFTVSKAIPLLYDNHLSEFVKYLFKKPCFGSIEAHTPPLHIDPYDQKKGNDALWMFSLVIKPRLAPKFHYTLWVFLKNLRFYLNPFARLYYWFQTSHNARKVYIVPLPDFTECPNPKDLEDKILWPRRKVINDPKDMSPFHRVIYEEKDYEIYRTPTIMAILDFKWSTARSVLLPLADIILGILYNYQVLTFQFSEFNSALAFTILVLWFELILLMRYFKSSGRYIYIIYSISTTIWPFFAFMLIAIIAFGLAMFILNNQNDSSLQIPTYKIEDTSNSDLYSNITIKQDIDKSSRLDNYYSNPLSSIEAVFFWANGRWDQLDQWDYPAVDVLSILGSIILVLIFQNMLIAFMNGAFDKANEAGFTAAYRYRAELTAEYEALEKPFGSKRSPQYIYYIPDPNMIDTWLKETKKDEKQELRHMGSELTDYDYDEIADDSDDDNDDQDNSTKYQNDGPSIAIDLDSIKLSTTKNDKISFIDEDDQLSIQERFNILETEFKTRFNELDQDLKTILKTLNNLNNPKKEIFYTYTYN